MPRTRDPRRARPRSALELALVSVLALALAAAAGTASARAGDGGRPAPPSAAANADEDLARVGDAIAGLRGRAFEYRVAARAMPCSLASARLLEIARLEGARCTSDVERAIAALGFVEGEPGLPPQVRPGDASRQQDQESGPCGLAFYDQIRKEVIVVDGRSSSAERSEVLAHELSHALQDQLFDLRARLRTIPRTGSGDHDAEELAANATVNEGEATAVELLYLWRRGDERSWIQGVTLTDSLREASVAGEGGFGLCRRERLAAGMRAIARGTQRAWSEQRRQGARAYYHALARFQYLVGAAFVADAYGRGGWASVDRLRSSPPVTTSELLHPERYFDPHDLAARIPASDLARAADLRLVYENRLGELGTSVVTEGDCPGWRGDRYRVLLRRADGNAVIEARFLFEDAASAAKLVTTLPRWLKALRVGGSSLDLLERRGRAVVLAAGLAQGELATARRALWASPEAADAVAAVGGAGRDDGALLLRQRGSDGQLGGELRVLEARERARVEEVLRSHLDAARTGSLGTDGRSWGLRQRPGGGLSWAEERADGRFVVATAPDRPGIDALREAARRAVPVEPAAPEPGRAASE